ncbi:hypothetical protein TUM20249_47930 [Pseudomonas tohonis]|nr:hypothetical protein TUM20249_47930 [Pseudomonas tohonis]
MTLRQTVIQLLKNIYGKRGSIIQTTTFEENGGPGLTYLRVRPTHIDVDADTNNDTADVCGVPNQLEKNSRYLAAIDQNIVGPLEPNTGEPAQAYCSQDSQPYYETKAL